MQRDGFIAREALGVTAELLELSRRNSEFHG